MNQPRGYVGFQAEATFEQLLEDLNLAVAWIQGFGIRLGPGSRFLQYRALMTELIHDHRNHDWRGGGPEHAQRYLSAAFEVADLNVIRRSFDGDLGRSPGLPERLQEIVAGPERIAHERPNAARRARNIAFELVMAGRIASAGFPIDLTARADVRTVVDQHRIVVECKRPMSVPAMRGNLDTAMRQGREGIQAWPAGEASYIAALEASPAVNPGNRLLQANIQMDQALDQLSDDLYFAVRRSLPEQWPRELVGVIARFSGLIVDRERNIPVYTQQWATIWNNRTDPHRIAAGERLSAGMREPEVMRRIVQR